MKFEYLIETLKIQLKQPLPGRQAQLKMSSLVRIQELFNYEPPANIKRSGVLILLYPVKSGTGLVLMLRPQYSGVHSGQISLPGGKAEPEDHDLSATALRESKEEVGVEPNKVHIMGNLTDLFIPPSNFLVTPFIGYQESRPVFIPDPEEVAQVIEITIDDLLNNKNVQRKRMKLALGMSLKVPAFCIDGHVIWGATAMILSEFREILFEIINHDQESDHARPEKLSGIG